MSAIYYNPTCVLCGRPVVDPFWDEVCSVCDGDGEADDAGDRDFFDEEDW